MARPPDDDTPGAKTPSGAKKKRAAPTKPAPRARKAAAKAEKPAKAEKLAKADKPEKPEKPSAPRAPARAKAAKPAAARPRKAAARAAAPPSAPVPRKPSAPRPPRRARNAAAAPALPETPAPEPVAAAEWSEEERIEDAKYQPRERPARAFEEERFLFPETYGENRVRLLVKDPQWLFAHWDVAPASFEGLRHDVGERTAALSRLTLRIRDPHHGGASVILLPEGVRSWYVKADREPRAYRAELGFMLPSGEFRSLAESNTVRTPWVGSSGERAGRPMRFDGVSTHVPYEGARPAPAASPGEAPRQGGPGPWHPEPATEIGGEPPADAPPAPGAPVLGGASDVHRR